MTDREKRPRDANQLAKSIVDIATGASSTAQPRAGRAKPLQIHSPSSPHHTLQIRRLVSALRFDWFATRTRVQKCLMTADQNGEQDRDQLLRPHAAILGFLDD